MIAHPPFRAFLALALTTTSAAAAVPGEPSGSTMAGPASAASGPASAPALSPRPVEPNDGLPACSATLAEEVNASLRRHPVVHAGRAAADALRGQGRVEAAWKDPSVYLEARGMPITEPWNMGRTPMGGVAMGMSATLPWLPRRWALERARGHDADAVSARVGERTLDLEQAAMMLLVDDELLRQQAHVLTDRSFLLRSLAEVARANATVGVGAQSDAVLLEAKAAQVIAQHDAIDARRDALRARWSGLLPDVAWPACRLNTADEGIAAVDDDTLQQRPFLRALDAERRAADARASAAVQSWIPEPTVRAGYVWRPDYGAFDGMDFFGGMVSIPLPISPGQRLGSAASAAAQTRRADAERRAFLLDARGQRSALLQELAAEQRQLDELRSHARPLAQAASQVAQAAYAAGEGSVAAIVEAERLVLDVDLAVLEAKARQARLRLALRRIDGGEPTSTTATR